MCLVIVKPHLAALPTQKTLETAFANNPDGMGLAFRRQANSAIYIRKGAMLPEEMKPLLKGLKASDEIVYHFRLATQGMVSPENCHPFPISNKIAQLRATQIVCNMAIAHNGIIPHALQGSTLTDLTKPLEEKLSDTQEFIRHTLYPLRAMINKKALVDLVLSATSGKFAVMLPYKTFLWGSFIQEGEIFYSNNSYVKPYPTYPEIENMGWLPYYRWNKETNQMEYTQAGAGGVETEGYKELLEETREFCGYCGRPKTLRYTDGPWLCESCGT